MKGIKVFCIILALFTAASLLFSCTFADSGLDVNSSDPTQGALEADPDSLGDRADDPIAFSDLKYLAFGDSITEGGNLESRSQAYPNVAGSILGCSVTNLAVGGSTFVRDPNKPIRHCITEDVVSFCEGDGDYDIISVAGGVNDQSLSFPIGTIDDCTTETVYGSLNIIVQTLLDRYSDAFIFLITPLKYSDQYTTSERPNRAGYDLSAVSDAIKAIGEKYDLPVLDLYSTSGFETAASGMNHPDCDGWHPLKEFVSEHLAPQVADFIRENYE